MINETKNAYDLANWFWYLEQDIEKQRTQRIITQTERNQRIKEIRDSRHKTMLENDPFLKRFPQFKELFEK